MYPPPPQNNLPYDVVVVGGGPAGMMAAITAADQGGRVLLIEKNNILGKKLLITGGGRCNVTNATFDHRTLAESYGKKGKFLFSPLTQFDAQSTIDFFESRGMPTMLEAQGRIFPASGSAQSVWDVLVQELKRHKIKVLANTPVAKVIIKEGKISGLQTAKEIITGTSYIITTGGTSHPETGSSGDGFKWLKNVGHTVITPESALVPIKISDEWVHNLQGVALPKVKLTILKNNIPAETRTGKLLFTHFGISGPLALNMSYFVGEAMKESLVTLALNIFPDLSRTQLDEKLLLHFATVQNKKWKNALIGFIPARLRALVVEMSGINPELFVNEIPKIARLRVVDFLRSIIITPTGLLGPDKAVVSSGGVALQEIDFKTMGSKIIENLYLAGDILDFDRPSGGFSLQICWTTGFVAGKAAAQNALKQPKQNLDVTLDA